VTAFNEIVEGLKEIVGQGFVKTGPDEVKDHAVDDRVPRAVVFPGNTREVSEVVQLANREHLAIVPRGSGSKMAMGHPPKALDLVVSTARMNHMLDVDTSNLTITVEAGVKFRDIQARLATQEDRCYLPLEDLTTEAGAFVCSDRSHSGCFLPIDPFWSETATIGGVIAANSAGPRRLLYNLPRDMILGVRLVSPDGEIAGAGGKTVKNVSAYDTSKLMVGSMGSLGIICEMTFKLLPLPEKMETLLIAFEQFSDASAFASRIFETSLLPAAVEVMNAATFDPLSQASMSGLEGGPYVVAVALEAFHKAVDRMAAELGEMATSHRAKAQARLDAHAHQLFWLAVSHLDTHLSGVFPDMVKARLNYPVSKWQETFRFVEETLSHMGIECAVMAHAGSGICLIHLPLNGDDTGALEKTIGALNRLLGFCVDAGGNLVIQKAPVRAKPRLEIWGKTGPDFIMMQRIKAQLDPSGIMSPGRFVGGL